jgi:hypothetical protein
MQLIPRDIHSQRHSTPQFPLRAAINYHKTRKDKADRDFKTKIAAIEKDENHVRRLTSQYMCSLVITQTEGNQAAPATANETDSLGNENQGSLTQQNL